MAIKTVTESIQRSNDNSPSGRRYSRMFIVLTDDVNTGIVTVALALDPKTGLKIPAWGENHPEDHFSIVQRVAPIAQTHYVWHVEVDYDTLEAAPVEPTLNPLDEPETIDYQQIKSQEPMNRDVDGKPVTNTLGEEFDDFILRDVTRPVLVISKNQQTFSMAQAGDYADSLNNSLFWGVPEGWAKIASITAASQFRSGIFFWRVRYEIHFRRKDPNSPAAVEPWDAEPLNMGTRTWVDPSDPAKGLETIKDANKEPFQKATPIDEGGIPILPMDGVLGDLHFLHFKRYEKKNFGALPIPQ